MLRWHLEVYEPKSASQKAAIEKKQKPTCSVCKQVWKRKKDHRGCDKAKKRKALTLEEIFPRMPVLRLEYSDAMFSHSEIPRDGNGTLLPDSAKAWFEEQGIDDNGHRQYLLWCWRKLERETTKINSEKMDSARRASGGKEPGSGRQHPTFGDSS